MPTLQQDPTPVTDLITTLIQPRRYTFSNVLSIQPPVDFVTGLIVQSPPINIVTISLLEKACYSASDVSIVAGKAEVVRALIRTWLFTENTLVAQSALIFLVKALNIDHPVSKGGESATIPTGESTLPKGQGLMWRRIFHDKDVYGQIFSLCGLTTIGQDGQLNRSGKTIAQARLLDFLKIFADHETVNNSQIPEVERLYGLKEGGLLQFAALHMVDYKEDVLIHMTLIDFFRAYLSGDSGEFGIYSSALNSSSEGYDVANRLKFLISNGLHARTISYYIEPELYSSLDLNYLYGSAASYVVAYASYCYTHLLNEPSSSIVAILSRLSIVLHSIPKGQWAIDKLPRHDLKVLSSLPRVTLLPTATRPSLLNFIPLHPASTAGFETLDIVFGGPKDITRSSSLEYQHYMGLEKAVSRMLYFLYTKWFPSFWKDVISAAETVAVKERALAAIDLLGSIVGATWDRIPSNTNLSALASGVPLPTDSQFIGSAVVPLSGALTVMTSPAYGIVIPYLLRPAQVFSNLVGGRGDAESAAYKIAVAKYDVLRLLNRKLKEYDSSDSSEENAQVSVDRVRQTIIAGQFRLSQGSMGGNSEVGGRIGTSEL